MAYSVKQLKIVAEPRASCRERYPSEHNKRTKTASNFIQAEENLYNLGYPSLEIPKEWHDSKSPIYIRVTSVTVPMETGFLVCIHPYPIDTDELDVIRDPDNNTLYFPIKNEDVARGYKSFRISRRKLVQNELKTYGPLRIVDSNRRHVVNMTSKTRSKELIQMYSLWKSQLLFSRAEHLNGVNFKTFPSSTVFSQVICDDTQQPTDEDMLAEIGRENQPDTRDMICTPEHGCWNGGDRVLMVLTKLDRKKPVSVYFDYRELNEMIFVPYQFMDMKTILFKLPACLLPSMDRNYRVPLVVIQDGKMIGKFDFLYVTSKSFLSSMDDLSSPSDDSGCSMSSLLNSEHSPHNIDDW